MICAHASILNGLREVRDFGLAGISCSDQIIWFRECTPTLCWEMSTLGTSFTEVAAVSIIFTTDYPIGAPSISGGVRQ